MEFRDQVIAVCGVDNAFGWCVVDTLLRKGARAVVAIGGTANCAPIEGAVDWPGRSGGGELISLPDAALDRSEDIAAPLGEHGGIDAVINLIVLCPHPRGHDGETANDVVARRTSRVVDAVGGLLRSGQAHPAIVNCGWHTPCADNALSAQTAVAAGSLEVLTKALAKELAPRFRVNAVLSMAVPASGATAPGQSGVVDGATRQLEEAAGPALFLASAAARHMTGTVLLADAGRSLGFSAFSRPDET